MTIYDRIDSALEKARWRNLRLRGIYLDKQDYRALAEAETARHRATFGGRAKVWPLSYDNELIIGGSAVVKEAKDSAIYATSGEAIYIPKRLSAKTRAAA